MFRSSAKSLRSRAQVSDCARASHPVWQSLPVAALARLVWLGQRDLVEVLCWRTYARQ